MQIIKPVHMVESTFSKFFKSLKATNCIKRPKVLAENKMTQIFWKEKVV